MANLLSRNANFEEVKLNQEALEFHMLNWQSGQRYPLAKLCYQYYMMGGKRNA